MESLISKYSSYSTLAQAAYADLEKSMTNIEYTDALTNTDAQEMTGEQAIAFVSRYEVKDSKPNTPSGFSGALFYDTVENKYVMALRGTEFELSPDVFPDLFLTDLGDIGADGLATRQIIDMYNWFLELTTQAGETIRRIDYTPTDLPFTAAELFTPSSFELVDTGVVAATDGELVGKTFDVTGHSLGGHLALAMSHLAPSSVQDVYTYNAVGFDPSSAFIQGSDEFFRYLRAEIAAAMGASDIALDWSENTAENTFNIVTLNDIVSEIGMVPGSPPILSFSEASLVTDSTVAKSLNALAAHSIIDLTRALDVSSLLYAIDPSLGVEAANALMGNFSNDRALTLESVLNTLVDFTNLDFIPDNEDIYTLLRGGNSLYTAFGIGPGNDTDAGYALTPIVEGGFEVVDVVSAAKSGDRAALYALQKLNPFLISGGIADVRYQQLYDSGELNAENVSNEYLAARSKFLSLVLERNENDITGHAVIIERSGEPFAVFTDVGTGIEIQTFSFSPDAVRYIFGNDQNNTTELVGGGLGDYLFGRGGQDVLIGNGGADQLFGGTGNDQITGGTGVDLLSGGQGADRFYWNTGDEDDVIVDYDDAGDRILVNNIDLASLKFQRASTNSPYYIDSAHPDITMHYEGDFLTINIGSGSDAGSITVTQFTPALGQDYGIVLNDYTVAPPVTDITVATLGNSNLAADDETDPSAYYRQTLAQRGLDWSTIGIAFDATAVSNYTAGTLHGTSGGAFEGGPVDDSLVGGSGSNALHGLAGNDFIDGDGGDDFLEGGAGSDRIAGGEGSDLLFGSARVGLLDALDPADPYDLFYRLQSAGQPGDTDTLDGGAGDDFISGGEYSDHLDGGAGTDYVLGGTGSDFISGGSDRDVIYGDSALNYRYVELTPGIVTEELTIAFADGSDTVAQYDDMIHAGAGDDTVWGELGDDTVYGEDGDDNLIGDRYVDTAYFSAELPAYTATSPELEASLQGDDRLFGGAGSDLLMGLAGDDLLAGGTDNDTLLGGLGNDTYSFEDGDGQDIIEDSDGIHTLLFSDIALSDLQVVFQGEQVRVGTGLGVQGYFLSRDQWDNVQIAIGSTGAIIERSRLDTSYFDAVGNLLLTVNGTEPLTEAERDSALTVDTSDPDRPRLVVGAGADTVEIEANADGSATMRIMNSDAVLLVLELTQLQLGSGLEFLQLLDGISLNLLGFSGGVVGFGGDDLIIGGNGADQLHGGGGDDVIEGSGGDDDLDGGIGNDVLRGGSGNDYLYGGDGAGSDVLEGGAGADALDGGSGSDTYVFARGDGQDLIADSIGSHYLVFDSSVDPGAVLFYYTGSSDSQFRLEYGPGDSLVSQGISSFYHLGGITVDGSEIPLVQRSDLLDGTFYDTRWNDVFETSDGNDIIHVNGWGDDVIRLFAGDGQDTIVVDNNYYPELMGEIRLGADIDLDGLSFSFQNGDAVIAYGAGDQIRLDTDTVYTYLDNTLGRFTLVSEADPDWVPVIRAEGYVGDFHGSFGTDHMIGSDHAETILPGYGDDIIEAGDAPDRIVLNDVYMYQAAGGIGHKQIWGQGDNDTVQAPLFQGLTIHYELGDGHDRIEYDWSYSRQHPYRFALFEATGTAEFQANGEDVLVFGEGITLADLSFTRIGTSLSIALVNGTGSVTVADFFHAWDVETTDGRDLYALLAEEGPVGDSLLETAFLSVLPKTPISTLSFSDGSSYAMASVLDAYMEEIEITDATVMGTPGDDELYATAGDDVIYGLGGDDDFLLYDSDEGSDRFIGGAGYDRILGSNGNMTLRLDSFLSSDGIELVDGGYGSNRIIGTDGGNVLDFSATALVNVDSIDGGAGDDHIVGSEGDDRILGGSGDDSLLGGAGDDSIDDLEGSNQIDAGDGDDAIVAADESVIDPGSGNDYIDLQGGNNTIQFSPGSGADTLYFDVSSVGNTTVVEMAAGLTADDIEIFTEENQWGDRALTIYLPATGDTIFASAYTYDPVLNEFELASDATLTAILFSDGTVITSEELLEIISDERGGGDDDEYNFIVGTPGNDKLVGTEADDVLVGLEGNDTLRGEAGDDYFVVEGTGQGIDRFIGGDGLDMLVGDEEDDTFTMSRMLPADSVELVDGFAGLNIIAGTSGGNVLDFSATGLYNIAAIDAGAGNDRVTGSQGDDLVIGGPGNDTLRGEGGDDIFVVEGADQGRDRIIGGAGFDTILGGEGDDTFTLGHSLAADSIELIDGGLGNNTIAGTSGGNTLDFSAVQLINIAFIDAGAGNDRVTGSQGDDRVIGGAGNDTLRGEGGDDIFVVEGTDQGRDRIIGGAGFDTILGGEGDDTFTLGHSLAADSIELIDGGLGYNTIAGTSGGNTLDFTAVEVLNIATIEGGGGNDKITGSLGNDTLAGGVGNDTLSGGAGDDSYLFGIGDGRDTINNNDVDSAALDSLRITGIDHDDLWLSRSGNNLLLDVVGTDDRIMIRNWYSDEAAQLDAVYAGGRVLLRDEVDQLVNAMASFDVPTGVGALVPDETHIELEPTLTAVWQLAA